MDLLSFIERCGKNPNVWSKTNVFDVFHCRTTSTNGRDLKKVLQKNIYATAVCSDQHASYKQRTFNWFMQYSRMIVQSTQRFLSVHPYGKSVGISTLCDFLREKCWNINTLFLENSILNISNIYNIFSLSIDKNKKKYNL